MKLSIITINKNNANGVKKTIESVACQTFKDFEYIVIDGASSDESVAIIKKYSTNISYWISEPDGGIYDAMNKGIQAANGEYCLFLNSGDYLCSDSALENTFGYNFFEDIVYGDVILEDYLNKKTVRKSNSALSILNFFIGSNWTFINHQNCFIKRALFSKIGFYRTDLKILSDQAFFLKAILEYGVLYRYIPVAISVYDLTGISGKNRIEFLKESDVIVSEHLKYPMLYNSLKSIAFYDKVYNTPLVKSWYNFYNNICEFKLKIKRRLGKDFLYNTSKSLNKQIYKQFAPQKIRIQKNKKVLVWGTGIDSVLIYNYCSYNKIFIYGFLDSNEAKRQYAFHGRPVFDPQIAFENKNDDYFIIIASRNYCDEIAKICREAGLVEKKDFIVPFKNV